MDAGGAAAVYDHPPAEEVVVNTEEDPNSNNNMLLRPPKKKSKKEKSTTNAAAAATTTEKEQQQSSSSPRPETFLEIQTVPVNEKLQKLYHEGQIRVFKLNQEQKKIFGGIAFDAKTNKKKIFTDKMKVSKTQYKIYNVIGGTKGCINWKTKDPWNGTGSGSLVLDILDEWSKYLLPNDPDGQPKVCPGFLLSPFTELQNPHIDYKRLTRRRRRSRGVRTNNRTTTTSSTTTSSSASLLDDPGCMPYTLHLPFDENGGWLHLWTTDEEVGKIGSNQQRIQLGKPILIHIPYGYACALRWDVLHAGHFVYYGNDGDGDSNNNNQNQFVMTKDEGKENLRFFAAIIPSDDSFEADMEGRPYIYEFPEDDNISFPAIPIV